MKVVVLVKEVPDAAAPKRLDAATKRLDRSGTAALNEFDTHALEEALRVRDAAGEGEAGSKTVVLAVGEPPSRGDTVRIEEDGNAAERIVEYLTEKKLV